MVTWCLILHLFTIVSALEIQYSLFNQSSFTYWFSVFFLYLFNTWSLYPWLLDCLVWFPFSNIMCCVLFSCKCHFIYQIQFSRAYELVCIVSCLFILQMPFQSPNLIHRCRQFHEVQFAGVKIMSQAIPNTGLASRVLFWQIEVSLYHPTSP